MKQRTILFPGRRISVKELTVPAEPASPAKLRAFLQIQCADIGFGKQDNYNLRLAVDEAASNIVRHAYPDKPGNMTLKAELRGRYLRLELVDQGKPFAWNAVKDPNISKYVDDKRKGGLGIWFIRKLTDASDYRARADGNHLVMWKRLPEKKIRESRGILVEGFRVHFIKRSATLLGGATLLFLLYAGITARSAIKAQAVDRAMATAKNVAAASLDPQLRGGNLALASLAAKTVANDSSLAYAVISNNAGIILGSSDPAQLLTRYQPPPGVKNGRLDTGVVRWKNSRGEICFDVAAVIHDGKKYFGDVHVGIKNEALVLAVAWKWASLAGLGLLVVLVGVAGNSLLIRMVAKPLGLLTEGVIALGQGKLDHRIEIPGHDEFGHIAKAFNEMTEKVTNAQKDLLEQESLRRELQVAKVIQQTLLPRELPRVEGYDVSTFYQAAKDVGGDYYDFIQLDRKRIGICMADVSGKGVPGSLVMAMIRTSLRAEARNSGRPAEVLRRLNSVVSSDMKKGMFVTLYYMVLDSHKREISYASAGHNPLVLYRSQTKKTYFLKPGGFPIGISLPDPALFGATIREETMQLAKGDVLVAYTDGILEAMNPRREQFGQRRFLNTIREHSLLPSSEIVSKLNEQISLFTQGYPQFDDITLATIKEGLSEEEMRSDLKVKMVQLIEEQGVPVATACHRLGLSPAAWYNFKKQRALHGKQHAMRVTVRPKEIALVSMEERELISGLILAHPQWGPKDLARELREISGGSMDLHPQVVEDDLRRLKLTTREQRQHFVASRQAAPAPAPQAPQAAPPAQADSSAPAPAPDSPEKMAA